MNVHVFQNEILYDTCFKVLYRGQTNQYEQPHGFGISYKHGDVYVGSFYKGYHHGYGILKCHSGYKRRKKPSNFIYVKRGVYIGKFRYNKLIDGKFFIMNDNRIHIGYRKNGIPVGKETFVSQFSTTICDYDSHRNIGQFTMRHSTSTDIAYLRQTNFQGIYYSMYYSPKFHMISHFQKNQQSGPVLFLRYSNHHVLYKILMEFKNALCQTIQYIQDDYNLIWNPLSYIEKNQIEIPYDYRCPIQHEVMTQPYLTEYKTTYELQNLTKWISIKSKPRDPLTNQPLNSYEFTSNVKLQDDIFDFLWSTLLSRKVIGTLSE